MSTENRHEPRRRVDVLSRLASAASRNNSSSVRPIEHEDDAGDLVGAIAPSVGRSPLDEDVALFHQGFANVHEGPNLPFEDDRIVDAGRLVEAGMTRRG